MDKTLLLSPIYQPMGTISWRKAIVMLTLGKVEVVEEYERDIRSTSLVMRLPSVVRLVSRLVLPRMRLRYSKRNVLARDRWTCQYCGKHKPPCELTQDHVIPRAQGGKTCWENVVTCCIPCNVKKADRTPEQAGLRLRARPQRPGWLPIFVIQLGREVPDAWLTYCYHVSS